ncbi:hypothetical protein TNCT_504851 [Trichonephila clavata]|uniref:Uncharacterized protein n=1 Tax=Trichonephila clavata TaxID=2740835 RepID=A0A8X6HBS0_TRICU|nr:hypothetical protein TNCT_504851 [Trichonephila clavata]
MESCSFAASSSTAFDDEYETSSNSCKESAYPEPTRHDKELQEEKEKLERITRTVKKKLIANGEMDRLRGEARERLLEVEWNSVVVAKCREFISQHGKGVTYKQLYDYCKEHCMEHVPKSVKDYLLKKVVASYEGRKNPEILRPKEVKEPEEDNEPK